MVVYSQPSIHSVNNGEACSNQSGVIDTQRVHAEDGARGLV